jgi:hypothetical protein
MNEIQRITLLKGTLEDLQQVKSILLEGEISLVASGDSGYDSLVIGDGKTEARLLKLIPLNVSKGSVFLGVANPETKPGTPTQSVFYIANKPGTYDNFNLIIKSGEIAFFSYSPSEKWKKISILTTDTELSETSENLVQNKIITKALKDLENRIIERITINGVEVLKINGTINLTVDSEFSNQSENPLMNRTISQRMDEMEWYEGE